jgi:hypothetical protein
MLVSPTVCHILIESVFANSRSRSITVSLPKSHSQRNCASWCFWLSVFTVLILLSPSGATAAFRFVNDFEPYGLDSTNGSKFRDIMISDSNIVTLFWAAGIPHGRASLSRLFYRSLSPDGTPNSETKTIFADSLASIVNWIHVGSNSMGKWVLVNHLVAETKMEEFTDRGLLVWSSDAYGQFAGSEQRVGNEVQPQDYSHWGCSAVDLVGNYVVCWGNNREPDGSEVWCQLFNKDGSPRTDTIRVSSRYAESGFELRDQRNVKVAMNPDGAFAVVWQSNCDSCGIHTWVPHVFMRLYGASGLPRSEVLCVSCQTHDTDKWNLGSMYPDVAMGKSGDFAVVWRQYRYGCRSKVVLQRFHADGLAKGDVEIVDSIMCNMDIAPYVASDSAGNLVIAWQDDDGDGRKLADLKAKRYLPNGQQIGEEFKINDGNKNVMFVTTPVAINDSGLVGFLWGESRISSGDGKIQQHDMMQLMDLRDVGVYLCGDANNDRVIDRRDAIFLITYVLGQGQSPASLDHSDLNCDGIVDLADIVRLVGCLAGGDIRQTLCPQ